MSLEQREVLITRVLKYLDEVLASISAPPAQIEDLHCLFESPGPYTVEYSQFWTSFASEFLRKNFLNTTLLFLDSPVPIGSVVLDCGGGSGATTLAYLTAQQLRAGDGNSIPVSVDFLDRNSAQLQLAKAVLAGARDLFPSLAATLRFHQADLNHAALRASGFDAVIAGHVLTENRTNLGALLTRLAGALKPAGRLFIMEDAEDAAWPGIDAHLQRTALPRWAYEAPARERARYTRLLTPRLAQRRSRCLLVSRLASELSERLVEGYFRAWREQSIDALDQVFTPDARYLDLTCPWAVCGLEAIREYWRQHVLPQTGLRLAVMQTFESVAEVACEFDASFGSPLHGDAARFVGAVILTFDPHRQRVSALREYFHRADTLPELPRPS